MPENYTIRNFQPGDGKAINDGFNEIFGLTRTLEEWHWKFDGGDQSTVLAFDDDGRIIAHFGAVWDRMKIGDQVYTVGHAVDSYRIRRPSTEKARVFVEVGQAFFDQYIASGKHTLLYGFPGERAMRVGAYNFNYGEGGKIQLWKKAVKIPWYDFRKSDPSVALPPDSEIDELWARAKGRYAIAMVRDGLHFRKRFLTNPAKTYHYLTAHEHGHLAALGVFLQAGDVIKWIDLLWDGQNPKTLAQLEHNAMKLGRFLGVKELQMWLRGDAQAADVLRGQGWASVADEGQPYLSVIPYLPDLKTEDFFEMFYLNMSDSDLV